jgi:hypothetical protein
MSSMIERNPRQLEDLAAEIRAMAESVEGLGHRAAEAHPERPLLGFQAGVAYSRCPVSLAVDFSASCSFRK